MRLLTIALALLVPGAFAAAQGHSPQEEMRRKMEEIAQLMRESERLLLEIAKADRLIAAQEEIVRRLQELEPPPSEATGDRDLEKEREELRRQQAEIERKLSELLSGQKQRGQSAVERLRELLANLPRMQNQGGGGQQQHKRKSRGKKEEEERLRRKREEKKQNTPQGARDKRELFKDKQSGSRRPEDKTERARLRRIEAWIARLPPEAQERINRGDLSTIPARYRRLVREYTALRAKREAEEESSGVGR